MPQKVSDNFGFYAILTNPVRGYEYVTNILVEHEIAFVQLRMKEVNLYTILRMAEKLRIITENSKTKLIINDYPKIAFDSGADGVHVGQSDISIEEARFIAGENAIIGLSTHNPEQTEEGCKKKPDYIGIGPVFHTPTKKVPDPVIGIEGMKKMMGKATVPAVCIGGITFEKLPDILEAGAVNFCMVRPICETDNPGEIIRKILNCYNTLKINK